MDTGLGLLGIALSGIGSYAFGKSNGYKDGHKDGYNLARYQDSKIVRQYQSQCQSVQCENAELIGQKNRLLQENEILRGLLSQQPTTPQSEAILKSLQRVELRLTEALPSILDDGESHNTMSN